MPLYEWRVSVLSYSSWRQVTPVVFSNSRRKILRKLRSRTLCTLSMSIHWRIQSCHAKGGSRNSAFAHVKAHRTLPRDGGKIAVRSIDPRCAGGRADRVGKGLPPRSTSANSRVSSTYPRSQRAGGLSTMITNEGAHEFCFKALA
jgi:hypothetical protein